MCSMIVPSWCSDCTSACGRCKQICDNARTRLSTTKQEAGGDSHLECCTSSSSSSCNDTGNCKVWVVILVSKSPPNSSLLCHSPRLGSDGKATGATAARPLQPALFPAPQPHSYTPSALPWPLRLCWEAHRVRPQQRCFCPPPDNSNKNPVGVWQCELHIQLTASHHSRKKSKIRPHRNEVPLLEDGPHVELVLRSPPSLHPPRQVDRRQQQRGFSLRA